MDEELSADATDFLEVDWTRDVWLCAHDRIV